MIIYINDMLTVGDLQERFSKCFPLLKIEFYRTSHKWKQHSSPHDLVDPMTTIETIRKIHDQGTLEIKSWYQSGKVENDFKNKFGLNVQVYRRRHSGWIQTVSTDNLTLKEQSDLAAASIQHSIRNIV